MQAIITHIDQQGRILIPKCIRESLQINLGDILEMTFETPSGMTIRPVFNKCKICGKKIEEGAYLCSDCVAKIVS